MFSVILYMLRQTVDSRAPLLLFPSFSPLTMTFPKLSVILRPVYIYSLHEVISQVEIVCKAQNCIRIEPFYSVTGVSIPIK
jgi:hypothetical protein